MNGHTLCVSLVSDCEDGSYGWQCGMSCHCENDAVCHYVTGKCPGDCAQDWTGDDCATNIKHITDTVSLTGVVINL